VRDQTCLPCEFDANPSGTSRDISYTNKKPRLTAPKNNLPQFTACGKEWQKLLRAGSHTPVSQQII